MIRKMHLLQLARGGGGEWGGQEEVSAVSTSPGRLRGQPHKLLIGLLYLFVLGYRDKQDMLYARKQSESREGAGRSANEGRPGTRARRGCAMDAHEGSLLECLVLILDRKSNFKMRGCAREHVCLAWEEVCMGMVVIGGGGCLQTTAVLAE